ncbi:MAG: hypothetical protein AB7U82_15745 [Blastocatellales bacterium]
MLIKAALSTIFLAIIGRSYLRLSLPQSTGWPLSEKLALSWLIGAGVLGWMTHVSLLLSGRVSAAVWLIFGMVLVVDAAIHYRSILTFRPSLTGLRKISVGRISFAALPPLAFLVLQCACLLISSLWFTQGWDGTILWDLKAKAIYLDSASNPGALMAYLNSPTSIHSHLDYPLLLPSCDAWVFFWAGTADEQALKLIGPAFMLSLLALMVRSLTQILPAAHALLFACLLTTASYLFNHSKTGYADIPLAALAGAAAIYGADYLRKQTSSSLFLMALFTGFATLVKKEGILVAAVIPIAMTITLLFARKPADGVRSLLKSACLIAVIACPWSLFLMIHKIPGGDFAPISGAIFTANWNRFMEVIAFMPKLMSERELFGWFWIISAIVAIAGVARWNRPNVSFLGLTCAGYLAAVAAIYIFSAWRPYWTHVQSSLSRLLMHIAPVAVLFAGHSFAEQFFSKPKSDLYAPADLGHPPAQPDKQEAPVA